MNDWNGFSHEWADPSVTIGRRIAALMAFRGLSSHKLAPLVGVSHAAICKYRNYEDFPSSKVLLRLASALGVNASVLLGEIRPPKTLEQWEIDWMNAPLGIQEVTQ
jgi:transcriptional regulator with XRE-family HTH domain